jgi:hypothetical protein
MLLLLDKKEKPFLSRAWTRIKIFIKEGLIHRDWRGVFKNRAVGGSITIPSDLAQGLKDQSFDFLHNDFELKTDITTAAVLKDPACVKWALRQKRKGRIKRVFAGPLVANLPTEADGVLTDPAIDGLLFFSPWHRDLFLKFCKGSPPKTFIWAAGVDEQFWTPVAGVRDQILIYNKNPGAPVLEHVKEVMEKKCLKYKILTYGSYDLKNYQTELSRSRFVIFLSRSETQGVAMLEAWSSGVPTLHWNPGIWVYLGQKVSGASSCPYLDPSSGLMFQELSEFESKLNEMLLGLDSFDPRSYVLQKFTRSDSINKFLEIVDHSDLI